MHPEFERTRALLTSPLAGVSCQAVAKHPGGRAECWNAQQVVEHLCATWRLTTAGIEDRLRKGRPLQTRPTLMHRVHQFTVCRLGLFPHGREAPEAVRPPIELPAGMDGDRLIAQIASTLQAMDTALARIEADASTGGEVGAAVLTHHILGPLSVAQWRRFHCVHTRHHVPQIRKAFQG
ncbi:MAG: DinB family protein [Acidobacteriaceae bacterium]